MPWIMLPNALDNAARCNDSDVKPSFYMHEHDLASTENQLWDDCGFSEIPQKKIQVVSPGIVGYSCHIGPLFSKGADSKEVCGVVSFKHPSISFKHPSFSTSIAV